MKSELSVSISNEKALQKDNVQWRDKSGKMHSESIQLQYTLKEFERSNDSLSNVIKNAISKTKSPGKVTAAGATSTKIDTQLVYKYRDRSVDTCFVRKSPYFTNVICLKDSTLTSDITVINEQSILFKSKRETVDPPKHFFLWRWLQEKHTIIEVEVINSNPYIKQAESKFVNIVK